jgi:hypothetical protein
MEVRNDEDLARVRNFFNSTPVSPEKVALRFVEYHGKAYKCEFAIKGKDIIFHFFPATPYPPKFLSNVTEAFKATAGEFGMQKIEIERIVEEALEGGPVSIFAIAKGYGENVTLVDSLVPGVFGKLDAILAKNRTLR